MPRQYSLLLVIIVILLGLIWFWLQHASPSRADEKPKAADKAATEKEPGIRKSVVRAFMRKKLAASQSILEGLAVEDFDLIAEGAKQLKATGGAAEFMAFNDAEYVEHADDFRRVTNKLAVAAKEKRLDGATLAFLDITMSCVECHKHVRSTKSGE